MKMSPSAATGTSETDASMEMDPRNPISTNEKASLTAGVETTAATPSAQESPARNNVKKSGKSKDQQQKYYGRKNRQNHHHHHGQQNYPGQPMYQQHPMQFGLGYYANTAPNPFHPQQYQMAHIPTPMPYQHVAYYPVMPATTPFSASNRIMSVNLASEKSSVVLSEDGIATLRPASMATAAATGVSGAHGVYPVAVAVPPMPVNQAVPMPIPSILKPVDGNVTNGSMMGSADGIEPDPTTTALLHQIEYYFSAPNLMKDKYLLSHMDPDTLYIPIQVIADFRRVKTMTQSIDRVTDVMRQSSQLEVNEEGTHVRPRAGLPPGVTLPVVLTPVPADAPTTTDDDQNPRCTLILRDLPNASEEDIKALFPDVSLIKSIQRVINDHYVTFATPEEALEMLEEVRRKSFDDEPIHVRVMSGRLRSISSNSNAVSVPSTPHSENVSPGGGGQTQLLLSPNSAISESPSPRERRLSSSSASSATSLPSYPYSATIPYQYPYPGQAYPVPPTLTQQPPYNMNMNMHMYQPQYPPYQYRYPYPKQSTGSPSGSGQKRFPHPTTSATSAASESGSSPPSPTKPNTNYNPQSSPRHGYQTPLGRQNGRRNYKSNGTQTQQHERQHQWSQESYTQTQSDDRSRRNNRNKRPANGENGHQASYSHNHGGPYGAYGYEYGQVSHGHGNKWTASRGIGTNGNDVTVDSVAQTDIEAVDAASFPTPHEPIEFPVQSVAHSSISTSTDHPLSPETKDKKHKVEENGHSNTKPKRHNSKKKKENQQSQETQPQAQSQDTKSETSSSSSIAPPVPLPADETSFPPLSSTKPTVSPPSPTSSGTKVAVSSVWNTRPPLLGSFGNSAKDLFADEKKKRLNESNGNVSGPDEKQPETKDVKVDADTKEVEIKSEPAANGKIEVKSKSEMETQTEPVESLSPVTMPKLSKAVQAFVPEPMNAVESKVTHQTEESEKTPTPPESVGTNDDVLSVASTPSTTAPFSYAAALKGGKKSSS